MGMAVIAGVVVMASSAEASLIVPLQQATATHSQAGLTIDQTIDGDKTAPSYGGWGLDGGQHATQQAAWETVTDLDTSWLTFILYNNNGNDGHNIKKMFFQVTDADRSTFCDGLSSGGDVTTTWTNVFPTSASGTNGVSLSIPNPANGQVLSSGPTDGSLGSVYTITAPNPLGTSITGVSLLLLTEGGDLGWAGNGNLVLTEFELVPEPASLALLALGGLTMLRRRRRG